jgi:hypothetical protein
MTLFLFKLFMTPLLIGGVTFAGRRWGPTVSGLLVGLPIISGPISVFLTLQYGPGFAARVAVGQVAGMASSCLFCLSYGLVSRKWPVGICVPVALSVFLVSTALCHQLPWTMFSASLFLLGAVLAASRAIGRRPAEAAPAILPRWDLPARMLAATAFVLALTASARALGPQLSGLLAPFPVFAVVLGSFTHHRQGPAAAARLLRGIVLGAPTFIAFFVVVELGLIHWTLPATYLLGTVSALGTSLALFLAMRRQAPWFKAVFG